ncbi:dihydroxyacetone kinase subunit DhaL [Streptacidiphilus sp. P02-A3a]|uniref:dihydroxyacetone kinase subunit DhaL n=1 Tax=Streptacidiphilus sp. P02-A3a TaxID=2704468 RepID=UPI0015FC8E8A|nr:dihydroxyacetone kinase subunit DhaL [Streptacidiphilus sp. P02-A3a]QMU69623.1 dihydroxyacetone kinase subunit L [Streptacidiphilus sp. P02-A3a]
MTTFDGAFTRAWLQRFAESVVATEPELTELDQQAGDGDFGANLRTGVTCVTRALDRLPSGGLPAAQPLQAAADAFLDEVGGTSGPLFGLVLHHLAEAAVHPALTTPDLARGVAAGLAAVQRVGEAVPGDKTLVDALAPASLALQLCCPETSVDRALLAAADAAFQGVRSTRQLSARRGRASYLGERASGIPDPGAIGVGLLFASAARPLTALGPLLAEPATHTAPGRATSPGQPAPTG